MMILFAKKNNCIFKFKFEIFKKNFYFVRLNRGFSRISYLNIDKENKPSLTIVTQQASTNNDGLDEEKK